jgi:hypothetical protein
MLAIAFLTEPLSRAGDSSLDNPGDGCLELAGRPVDRGVEIASTGLNCDRRPAVDPSLHYAPDIGGTVLGAVHIFKVNLHGRHFGAVSPERAAQLALDPGLNGGTRLQVAWPDVDGQSC